jgi:hypothetical protein
VRSKVLFLWGLAFLPAHRQALEDPLFAVSSLPSTEISNSTYQDPAWAYQLGQ